MKRKKVFNGKFLKEDEDVILPAIDKALKYNADLLTCLFLTNQSQPRSRR
ncbi:MAG: hypothetical protein IPG02_09070 [Ignavibacteria bacterium]|nr:hypothetical protein [Ignavibacteria bacterium]